MSPDPERPITAILEAIDGGEDRAWSQLFDAVYGDLQQIASQRLRRLQPGNTLRTTDLVHESFLRLLGRDATWENRRHFFGAASRAMRDILVDEARRRRRLKRGGDWNRWELGDDLAQSPSPGSDDDRADRLIALNEVLEKLEKEDPLQYQIVMLRYFAGLKIDDVATILEISPSSVDRGWRFARAWLLGQLEED